MIMRLVSIVVAATFVGLIDIANAQSVCEKIDGAWSGSVSGHLRGRVDISVKSCSFTWVLPDGRRNMCSISGKQGALDYMCSLGSRGTVVLQGRRMTWRNTYTGNDYSVSVSKR